VAGVSAGRGVMMARLTRGAPAGPPVRRWGPYPGCRGRGVHVLSNPAQLMLLRAFPMRSRGWALSRDQLGPPTPMATS
jgi:hypothetical protein